MFTAAFAAVLIIQTGASRAALLAVVAACTLTTLSVLLFGGVRR